MSAIVTKQRLQWIDAMRGFSMILVVFGHLQLCMGLDLDESTLCMILSTFRMPLFFFVSGFFSFRALDWWTKDRVTDIVARKTRAQIVGTLVFCITLQFITEGIKGISLTHGFGGYWFTIVLFQMYLIYLLCSLGSRFLHKDIVVPALVVVSILFMGLNSKWHLDTWLWDFLCWTNLTLYMQFFTIGIICAKYRERFFEILRSNLFVSTMIICWVLLLILVNNEEFKAIVPFSLFYLSRYVFVRYFGLMVIIIMFYGAKDALNGGSKYSRWLQFVGRRTLDIYFIHYYLLPHLKFMAPWFEDNSRIVLQLGWGIPVTLLIVSVSLLVSYMIRRSATLAAWLFGERQPAQIGGG